MRGIVLILVLAASACSGADDSSEAVQTESDDGLEAEPEGTDEPENGGDEEAPDANEPGAGPETLDDYLGTGFLSLDPEEQAANYARQEQHVQELIAECMAAEGFEYIQAIRPVSDIGLGAPGDVEFATEVGFGITTYFGETESPLSEDEWIDPNQSIVDALSESERNAYYDTLYGSSFSGSTFDSDSAAATGEDVSGSVEGADNGFEGCSGQAYEQVYAFGDLQEIFEQLDFESLIQRVEADPRSAEIDAEWSECMAERGYDYEDPDSMYETVYTDFQERLEEIVGPSGGFFDPFAGMSEEETEELVNSMSPEELDDFFTQGQQTAQQDFDQEALVALQAEERALAVASAECSGDLYERFIEIYRQYEAVLVDENRTLLEQFRESRGG